MHEFAVMSYLLDNVEDRARALGATRVLAINLVVGERAGIVEDSLAFYLEQLAEGMLAEGARLNIRRTPMRFHCAACGEDYEPAGADFTCPGCRAVGRVADDGSALLIESIEIET